MSPYDIPSDKQVRMKDAERRVPRIVGLPPKRSGFVTRYVYPGMILSSMSTIFTRNEAHVERKAAVHHATHRGET